MVFFFFFAKKHLKKDKRDGLLIILLIILILLLENLYETISYYILYLYEFCFDREVKPIIFFLKRKHWVN